jgi:hypothetical protein
MRKEATTTNKLLASVCVVALATAPMMTIYKAEAATQGSLGATSTGSLNLSVKKDARVKISDLNDLSQNAWDEGQGDVVLTDNVCVYSTRANGAYKVTANGSGAANAFTLANGANIMPYALKWADSVAGAGEALTANALSTAFANANRSDPNCTVGGNNAKLEVKISAADMTAAIDGTYTGVLTLIVSPS